MKFFNGITNQIAPVQIESLWRKSNRQNGSNRNLNPNHDWDLPVTVTAASPVTAKYTTIQTQNGTLLLMIQLLTLLLLLLLLLQLSDLFHQPVFPR